MIIRRGGLGVPIVPGLRASFAAEPDVVIVERQKGSKPRRITDVSDDYVECVGVEDGRRTRVARRNLHRYVVVMDHHDAERAA